MRLTHNQARVLEALGAIVIIGAAAVLAIAAFGALIDGCAHPAPTVVTAPVMRDASANGCAQGCARVSGCPGWSGYDGGSCEQGCAALGDNYPEGTAIAACVANIAPGDCAAAEACKTGGEP